ncbi:type II toxin-antitoxin system PemK/MazF family toxin [Aureimonas ureilytica]|uniref:type II toxin-antitoxin system PemK/MazF family toxin n=1 Tax=Aureimonas ureilytica TaxID=401562 RepID=UPI0007342FA5|nr:type II toxin-antitoxin system PemK/MazF family toxin [Aureimonas ureilytica]
MITFTPARGAILMCDFDLACVAPEMRKKRRVVVMSPRAMNGPHGPKPGKCVVVPFSATTPTILRPSHVQIPAGTYDTITVDVWAICEAIAHVSHTRLDRVAVGRNFKAGQVFEEDMARIEAGIRYATGMPDP